jgi:hypothetical protein
MRILHIPNDNPQVTKEAIDASLPGDELIFDAGSYVLSYSIYITKDRAWLINGQVIEASHDFQSEYLFEIENELSIERCHIVGNKIDTKGKCGFLRFNGTNFMGLVDANSMK